MEQQQLTGMEFGHSFEHQCADELLVGRDDQFERAPSAFPKLNLSGGMRASTMASQRVGDWWTDARMDADNRKQYLWVGFQLDAELYDCQRLVLSASVATLPIYARYGLSVANGIASHEVVL